MVSNLSLRFIFPILLLLALFSIIIIKAYSIPITYDEVASTIYYPTFTNWQIMMYPDNWPSNHILNTLLIKLSFSLFGISPFSARLPNILAFIFYFSIVWSIAYRWFRNSWLYYAVIVCLTCNPYFLDFFGLARGYAMSDTFMTASVYFMLRYFSENRFKFFWLAYFTGLFASYSNFTLLIFFAAVNGILVTSLIFFFYRKVQNRKNIIVHAAFMFLCTIAYGALIYTPILKMNSTNQFIYWTSNGIIADTLKSLIIDSLYNIKYNLFSPDFITYSCVAIFTLSFIMVMREIIRQKDAVLHNTFVISFLVLFTTVLVNIFQNILLKTPNLYGRTAMCYFPLFVIPALFFLQVIIGRLPTAGPIIAVALCFVGIYHQVRATNTRYVLEWQYDQHTYDVINYLNAYRTEHNQDTVSLNTSWWFNPSFTFYQKTTTPWINLVPYHKDIDTTSNTPFFYATADDYTKLKSKYDIMINFDEGARMLLSHK
jgi:hypothetical protein